MTTQRFHVLDGWRGVCAVLVVLFHMNVVSHLYGLPLIRNGQLFVDFFFVLSGFVITHAYAARVAGGGVRAFVVRRIGRLWPLHMALLGAFIALEFVKLALETQGITYGRPTFTRDAEPLAIVTNVLMIHGWGVHPHLTWNNPSWSISVEWAAYLAFAAVYALAPKRAGLLAAGVALACLMVLATAGETSAAQHGLFRCGLGFGIGHLIHRLFTASRPLPAPTAFEAAAVALAAAVVWRAGEPAFALAAPFAFGMVVYVFAFQGGALSRLMGGVVGRRLGDWSYSIYMLQQLFFSVLTPAIVLGWRHMGWGEIAIPGQQVTMLGFAPLWSDLYAAGFLTMLIACSVLTYRYIEVPGRNAFARLAGVRAAPS